jgi:hypothetical protein
VIFDNPFSFRQTVLWCHPSKRASCTDKPLAAKAIRGELESVG